MAGPLGEIHNEIFYSDGEDDDDTSQSEEEEEEDEEAESHELMQEPFTQPSSLPFHKNSIEDLYYTRPEKKPRQQRQSRRRTIQPREVPPNNDRPAGEGQPGRMRESDCAKYWNNLTLHGHIP